MNAAAPWDHLRLAPHVEIVSDPAAVGEALVDLMIDQRSQPTGWLQRLRGRGAVGVTAIGQVPTFEGRACCYAHLRPFDGRSDLQFPFETMCPGCGRVLRIALTFMPAR